MDPIESEENLPGLVVSIPDSARHFEAVGRDWHPGAYLIQDQATPRYTWFSVGRGADDLHRVERYRTVAHVVLPTEMNGLTKATVFMAQPERFKSRQVGLWLNDRVIGRLDPADFVRLVAGTESPLRFASRGSS